MFFRIRAAFGIALFVSLFTSIMAFAKGGFSFISITGGNLREELRVTDPALTTPFFAFANFHEDKTEAPAEPGNGYEITRYYVDGKREIIFDRLHYYPETGYVFYDGIENGESEYDAEWYTANPEIKAVFEGVLPGQVKPAAPPVQQPVAVAEQVRSNPAAFQTQSWIAVVAGLAVLVAFAFWLRRLSAH